MLAVGVLVVGSDDRKEVEIGVSGLCSTNSGAAVAPACLAFVDHRLEDSDALVLSFFVGIILQESESLRFLEDVLEGGIEPLDLEESLRVASMVSMVHGKALEDGDALVHPGAIIIDIDG